MYHVQMYSTYVHCAYCTYSYFNKQHSIYCINNLQVRILLNSRRIWIWSINWGNVIKDVGMRFKALSWQSYTILRIVLILIKEMLFVSIKLKFRSWRTLTLSDNYYKKILSFLWMRKGRLNEWANECPHMSGGVEWMRPCGTGSDLSTFFM